MHSYWRRQLKTLDNGLEVTALHNHFFFDEPHVYFMHIGGMGDAGGLAVGVKKVYDKIAEIRAAQPEPQKAFSVGKIGSTNSISAEPLEAILGVKGQAKDGMFKVVIGRPASMHGIAVGKEMGIITWAAFAGSDSERRRWRFRDEGERTSDRVEDHAQREHQHRHHPSPHEPGGAAYLVPALLGKGQGLGLSKGTKKRSRCTIRDCQLSIRRMLAILSQERTSSVENE